MYDVACIICQALPPAGRRRWGSLSQTPPPPSPPPSSKQAARAPLAGGSPPPTHPRRAPTQTAGTSSPWPPRQSGCSKRRVRVWSPKRRLPGPPLPRAPGAPGAPGELHTHMAPSAPSPRRCPPCNPRSNCPRFRHRSMSNRSTSIRKRKRRRPRSRGLHSSTFRLNLSAFCGIGGALRDHLGVDIGTQG